MGLFQMFVTAVCGLFLVRLFVLVFFPCMSHVNRVFSLKVRHTLVSKDKTKNHMF